MDPQAALMADASAQIQREKGTFVRGQWNVHAVNLGGLGADADELAATRLQGLDEAKAAAEYVTP